MDSGPQLVRSEFMVLLAFLHEVNKFRLDGQHHVGENTVVPTHGTARFAGGASRGRHMMELDKFLAYTTGR